MITRRILLVHGQKVMLDAELAELYGVPTKRLNEQVKLEALEHKVGSHDQAIAGLIDAVRQLMTTA
jgi:hypothetical protein